MHCFELTWTAIITRVLKLKFHFRNLRDNFAMIETRFIFECYYFFNNKTGLIRLYIFKLACLKFGPSLLYIRLFYHLLACRNSRSRPLKKYKFVELRIERLFNLAFICIKFPEEFSLNQSMRIFEIMSKS